CLLDAVVKADAVIAVAAEKQAEVAPQALLDPGHAVEVSQMVLRDGPVPAHKLMKDGSGRDAERQPQLATHRRHETVVVPVDHLGPVPTAANCPQQDVAGRGAAVEDRGAPLHAED